jgi:hypothetical protein
MQQHAGMRAISQRLKGLLHSRRRPTSISCDATGTHGVP